MQQQGSDRLSDDERRARRGLFGSAAEQYDRTRPAYPPALFDALADFGGLEDGSRVVEIGPGTGQATVALTERGWQVEAVEIDPAMAALARRRLRGRAAIRVGAFEDDPPAGRADLVLCATAFHWLDPAVRVERVAGALRPGGTAAIIWTRHVRGGTQAFFDTARACYATWAGADPAMRLPTEEQAGSHDREFRDSLHFQDVESRPFVLEVPYDTAGYRDLISTYSETLSLDEAHRAGLLECIRTLIADGFEGRILKRYLFELVLARRR